MDNVNERNSDHCHLTGRAWREIRTKLEKQLGRLLEGWNGPHITADSGTYKLDWRAPDGDDAELADEYLTLYDDGVWQFYGKDGEIEGKILSLHHKNWLIKMSKDNVPGAISFFAVEFFKRLKNNG